jgi:hypothetical protein
MTAPCRVWEKGAERLPALHSLLISQKTKLGGGDWLRAAVPAGLCRLLADDDIVRQLDARQAGNDRTRKCTGLRHISGNDC